MKIFLVLFSFTLGNMGMLMASSSSPSPDIAVECAFESAKPDSEEKSKDFKLDLYSNQSLTYFQLSPLKNIQSQHIHISGRYFAAPFKPPRA